MIHNLIFLFDISHCVRLFLLVHENLQENISLEAKHQETVWILIVLLE